MLTSCFISCMGNNDLKVKNYSTLLYFNTNIDCQLVLDSEISEDVCDTAWGQIKEKLDTLEGHLSVYKTSSEVSIFNNAPADSWMEVSSDTFLAFSYAIKCYLDTNGAYNPAVYLLSDLWGFTNRFHDGSYVKEEPYDRDNYLEQLPDEKYINAFLQLTNFGDVTVKQENNRYFVYKPKKTVVVDGVEYTMKIDLGGIGKGLACLEMKKIFANNNITKGYVSVGSSSILALQKSEEDLWLIKYRHPRKEGEYYLSSYVADYSISTSGDYENYYEYNGKRYCHIINPFTGYPISTNIITSTVIMENPAYADAYTTALCVMGKEQAIEFIRKESDSYAFVYYDSEQDKYIIYTNASYDVLDTSMQVEQI